MTGNDYEFLQIYKQKEREMLRERSATGRVLKRQRSERRVRGILQVLALFRFGQRDRQPGPSQSLRLRRRLI